MREIGPDEMIRQAILWQGNSYLSALYARYRFDNHSLMMASYWQICTRNDSRLARKFMGIKDADYAFG